MEPAAQLEVSRIPHLEARDLAHSYDGRRVLEVPHFALRKGERYVLMGPNGAGKSTLLRILGLVEAPDRGVVLHRGSRIDSPSSALAARRRTAIVFQDPVLFHGSVLENVTYGLRVRGIGRRERLRAAGAMLERLNLIHLATRSARGLSGGEVRKVALASALVLSPELLLLDEPLASVDEESREPLLETIVEIARKTGATFLSVTHDLAQARAADRVGIMQRGRIVREGSPGEVLAPAASPGSGG